MPEGDKRHSERTNAEGLDGRHARLGVVQLPLGKSSELGTFEECFVRSGERMLRHESDMFNNKARWLRHASDALTLVQSDF